MDAKQLRSSLEALYGLREELHSKADDNVTATLDEVIQNLESALQSDSKKFDAFDALEDLGIVLELVAAIANLINMLK